MEKAQVLIVEDDAIIAMDIESQLKQLGYGVTGLVAYGEKVIEKIKENKPDLVLMDIVLKGEMGGIEAAEEIRNQFGIPVIFLTAFADKSRLERAKLTYPFGFIIKPFQDKDLEVTIEMALYVAKVDKERKQIEEELIKSEMLHKKAQFVAQIGHWDLDSPSGTPVWSEEIFHIFGLDPVLSEPSFAAHVNIIHDEDWDLLNRSIQDLSVSGTPFDIEFRILRTSGETRWMHAKGSAEKDENNRVTRMFGTAQDISERKRVENALRESEERYKTVFEGAAEGILLADIETKRFRYANPALCIMLGYTEEELKRMSVLDIHPEESLEHVISEFEAQARGGKTLSTNIPFLKKDGTIIYVDINTSKLLINGKACNVGFLTNITKRKQAEEALKESKALLEKTFASLDEAVFIVDPNTRTIVNSNPAMERIFGYSREEVVGRNTDFLYVDQASYEDFGRALFPSLDKNGILRTEFQMKRKDGTIFFTDHTVTEIVDDSGHRTGVVSVVKDVTRRKQAEEALLKSRTELRHLSSQLIRAQEEERKLISLELHDEMGSSLTEIGLNLTEIEENLPEDLDPGIRNRFADMHSIVSEASEKISELSLNLRPSMLDHLGLIPTLHWHFNQVGKRTSLEINFETFDIGERLDLDIETVLYRVSQETLNNIIKHADATNVTVRLEQKPEAIVLTIKDDGKGFDIDEILTNCPSERIGIIGMQERVSMVKGNLSIHSSKGDGTQVSAEIPLP